MIATSEHPPEAVSSREFPPTNEVVRMATPRAVRESGYYGLPLIKPPRWKWEIALYFFFGGVSAGSFVLAGMADLFGGPRNRQLVRRGRLLAVVTLLPCPPLLIADLGRPERFHHMLRIVKATSPMNTGAWAMTGYGIFAALLAARENLTALRRLPSKTMTIFGMPFALTMLAYPGVLLSATSNPVWSGTPFLGALIGCSSMAGGAAALSLSGGSNRALDKFESVVTACEAAALAGYLGTARRAAQPLLSGRQSAAFWMGAVVCGLVLPTVLGKRRGLIGSLLTLGGTLAMKWAITYAGHTSALDPDAAQRSTRPSESTPGWGAVAGIETVLASEITREDGMLDEHRGKHHNA